MVVKGWEIDYNKTCHIKRKLLIGKLVIDAKSNGNSEIFEYIVNSRRNSIGKICFSESIEEQRTGC